MKLRLWMCLWVMSALLGHGLAAAQDPASNYPSRPVSIIILVTPGGVAEAEVRLYTQKLQENLGKPFIFDYRPGAGGTIGLAAAANAAPDGYTLVAAVPALTTTPVSFNLPYDPIKSFSPVILLGRQAAIMAVNSALPVTNLQEYVAYARANPGKINWGTNGIGTTTHLVGAWVNQLTGTDTTFVHYKGPQMQTDLMGGIVQVTANAVSNLGPMVKTGKIRALAIAGPNRSPAFPDLKTAREQGFDFEYPVWVGISAPAGTPPGIINKLNAEFLKIQNLPETRQQMDRLGITPGGGSPADFARLIAVEIDRWKLLVKQTGMKLDIQ